MTSDSHATQRVPQAIGATTWVVADGYIPETSTGPEPAMTSHDSICMLNTGLDDALIEVYLYFTDRDSDGPHVLNVRARRAFHQRINGLSPHLPAGVDYSIVVTSSVPIAVQHTRLDSRQSANALMTTMAFHA